MKLSQSSLAVLGTVCAVIWLGCTTDNDNRANNFTIGSSLPISPKIAFRRLNEEGWHDIYVMNADGTNVVKITKHEGSDSDPAWSPDGRKIAFVSRRKRNEDIYVMNADGTNVVKITDREANNDSPAWSPDGKKIAFVSLGMRGVDIWVMNADGTNVVNITNHKATDYEPAWSPDGRKIAFASTRARGVNLFVMNADGTNAVKITHYGLGPCLVTGW